MKKLINTVIYAGRLKSSLELRNSSSGGAFTALSDYFLRNGNAIITSVHNYDNHNMEFRIILDRKQRDLERGLKYIQSKPGIIFCKAYEWLIENSEKN